MKNWIIVGLVLLTNTVTAQSYTAYTFNHSETKLKIIPDDYQSLIYWINNEKQLTLTLANGERSNVMMNRPLIFSAGAKFTPNSMDRFIQNIMNNQDATTDESEFVLGLYLLQSIMNEENNVSSGLAHSFDDQISIEQIKVNINGRKFTVPLKKVDNYSVKSLGEKVDFDGDSIHFTWTHRGSLDWIYGLEEKVDGKWQRLTPYIPFVKNPELTTSLKIPEGKKMTLRLVSHDLFGEKHIVFEEKTYQGKDVLPPVEVSSINISADSSMSSRTETTIQVDWEYPREEDEARFILSASIFPDSAYSVLSELAENGKGNQDHIVKWPGDRRWIYMKIQRIDSKGNLNDGTIKYMGIKDFFPPEKPENFSAQVDSLGIVTLQWTPSTEKDIIGYFVETSKSKNGSFQRLNELLEQNGMTRDTLSLNINRNSRWYRVSAVDESMHISPPSEAIELTAPDTIRPVGPVGLKLHTDGSQHRLTWKTSDRTDIMNWYVIGSSKYEKWDTLAVLGANENEWKTQVENPGTYTYQIQSRDTSGNYSRDRYLREAVYEGSSSIETLVYVNADARKDGLFISWNQSTNPEIRYIIHVGTTKNNLVAKKVVTQSPFKIPRRWKYSHLGIQAIDKEGQTSEVTVVKIDSL